MLSTLDRARLTVVLVGARNPGNIGATARAMHDFGFADLRVVNEFAPPFEAAQLAALDAAADGPNPAAEAKSAVHAASVLSAARRFDALAPALIDCTLVVGTTAIGGRELRRNVLPLQDAAPHMLAALRQVSPEASAPAKQESSANRVALLFGSEKTGLTNDQLSHCSLLTTIPMYMPLDEHGQPTRHLSMNLGQSVAVCLYELTRAGFEGARDLPSIPEPAATSADRERLTALLEAVMQATGYTRRYPHNAALEDIRRLALDLAGNQDRAITWMGILRQVLRRLRSPQPEPSAASLPGDDPS